MSFDKNIGTHATKVAKNTSNKYSQRLLDKKKTSCAKKATTNAIKSASKGAIQKTAEATGDFINW